MLLKLAQVWVLCLLAITTCQGERVRYDNYRLYNAVASSEKELEILKNLENSSDSIIFLNGIHHLNKPIKMVVAPHKVPDFLKMMGSNEVEYELLENNLQNQLENEVVGSFNPLARSNSYNWKTYYPLEDTYSWLRQLAVQHPGVVTLIEGGKTYEGRQILGVRISKSLSEKPIIVLEAGIHAREWIAPATATYVINALLRSPEPRIQEIADKYNWYIFPHANPDGFVYTHTTDRLWRKTRAPYGSCYGADPNRNWGFQWNVVGSSNNPCSDTYAGPYAFSEVETRTFSEFLKTLKINLYISFHAFSQYLLYPYGHTSSLPINDQDLKQVSDKTVAAIGRRYGTKYVGGNIHEVIYAASGASTDWVYEVLGTKMSFCYELRPSSNSLFVGFRLPASRITETAEETVDSIVVMVNEVEKLGYFKYS